MHLHSRTSLQSIGEGPVSRPHRNSRGRWLKSLVIGLVVVLTPAGLLAAEGTSPDSDQATEWLMKINKAAEEISFSGSFVYIHDNRVEAMEVARRVSDEAMQERLYALSGEAREIIRDMDRVWCYIPDKNVGVHDYRQITESGFPNMLPRDLPSLMQHYRFETGATARIANRMAQQIRILPVDQFRYGYHLWADTRTGLLLRSDLIGSKQDIVEQYLFVQIEIGQDIMDSELAPVTRKDKLVWYGMDQPQRSTEVGKSQWQINNPPAGFSLTRHIQRMTPMEGQEEEHFVFTDGLSTVSIFIKRAGEGQSSMEGLSRMGAIHAYRTTVEDHRITVMGEVPAATVEYMAQNISYRP